METLPEEIVTYLFSCRYSWREILAFRRVCRDWIRILTSLRRMWLNGLPPLPFLILFPHLEEQARIFSPKSATLLLQHDPRFSSRKMWDVLLEPETLGFGTVCVHHLLGWVAQDRSRSLVCQMTFVLHLEYERGTLLLSSRNFRFQTLGPNSYRWADRLMDDVLEVALDLLPIDSVHIQVPIWFLTDAHIEFLVWTAKRHPLISFHVQKDYRELLDKASPSPVPENISVFPSS